MESRREDIQIWQWKLIREIYHHQFPDGKDRERNEREAYWCRPAGDHQELFKAHPQQRIFARLLKSYQNTTWHQIQLSIPKQRADEKETENTENKRRSLITDHWFENPEIIKTAKEEIKTNAFFRNKKDDDFVFFCEKAAKIAENLKLKEYGFNEEQEENFDSLSKVISVFFEKEYEKKALKVSVYEKIIYEKLQDPYRTIMKMQKLLPGLGVALTCDFLKESHLCNIAKPDVHICHVFSILDGIPYSMDLPLVRRIAEFAAAACPEDPHDFCNSGAYNVDKIIWMLCSDYNTDGETEKKMSKDKFIEKLAE